MKYLGGKQQIARDLAAVITTTPGHTYIEPFLGGAAVFQRVAPHYPHAIGSDSHPDLMLMWQAFADGWTPPILNKAAWAALRDADPSPERGFAGFGCSYGGIFFIGWDATPKLKGREPYEARHNVTRIGKRIASYDLRLCDYHDHTDTMEEGVVVYCDPPYAENRSGYRTTRAVKAAFDNAEFWRVMDDWAMRGAKVYVSEYTAPADWKPVWEKEKRVGMAARSPARIANKRSRERLYTK